MCCNMWTEQFNSPRLLKVICNLEMSSGIKRQMLHVLFKNTAWEVCDDFERLCEEHIRLYVSYVERKRSEMRMGVGEAEKAGVDWTNSRLGQLRRHVSELRRREDELDQLSVTEDPIKFLQVITLVFVSLEIYTILCL